MPFGSLRHSTLVANARCVIFIMCISKQFFLHWFSPKLPDQGTILGYLLQRQTCYLLHYRAKAAEVRIERTQFCVRGR